MYSCRDKVTFVLWSHRRCPHFRHVFSPPLIRLAAHSPMSRSAELSRNLLTGWDRPNKFTSSLAALLYTTYEGNIMLSKCWEGHILYEKTPAQLTVAELTATTCAFRSCPFECSLTVNYRRNCRLPVRLRGSARCRPGGGPLVLSCVRRTYQIYVPGGEHTKLTN